MSRLRTLITDPQSPCTRPVAVNVRRAEWGALAMILLGIGCFVMGLAFSGHGLPWR